MLVSVLQKCYDVGNAEDIRRIKEKRRIMDTLDILRQLAIIIIAAKFFGLIARKCKAPQVAGEIIAGLLIGPSLFNLVESSDFLAGMAEIGVIILMFTAGLETNISDLKKTGVKASIIACTGVFVPLVLGTLLYMAFYGFSAVGSDSFYRAIFIGTILIGHQPIIAWLMAMVRMLPVFIVLGWVLSFIFVPVFMGLAHKIVYGE